MLNTKPIVLYNTSMQFDFNCLLTKSYIYHGDFKDVVLKICRVVSEKENFLISKTPVSLFYQKQTGDDVACYLTKEYCDTLKNKSQLIEKKNFYICSFSSSAFKEHIRRQITVQKQLYKNKIESLKEDRNNCISKCSLDAKTKKMMSSINSYCDDVLTKEKYTDLEERNDDILKAMNRYSIFLSNIKESKYLVALSPFIATVKYLRRYLEYFKLECKKRLLDSLSGLAVTIGKNNICNLSIFSFKTIDDLSEKEDKEEYWKSKAYKHSNGINALFDNYSLLFDAIDLADLFSLKGNDRFFVKEDNETEIKRAVYGKLSYSKDYFSKCWLKSFEDYSDRFACYKLYFTLMTTNIFGYRDVNFTSQVDLVYGQIKKQTKTFALRTISPYFINYNLSDFDNFLCRSNCAVLLSSAYPFFETKYLNDFDPEMFDKERWFYGKIANNHRHRFGFENDASSIFTSCVYSSMFSMSQSVLRNRIQKINLSNNHLTRLFKSHSFSTYYEKCICVYSSHGPFIKSATERVAHIVFKENYLKEQEADTELFVKNMWQESNLSNGKIFPLIQAFAAIVSLVALILSFSITTKSEVTISIVASCATALLLLGLIPFVIKNKK